MGKPFNFVIKLKMNLKKRIECYGSIAPLTTPAYPLNGEIVRQKAESISK
jgi:hypothetical protein